MTQRDLSELALLCEARFQAEQAKLREVAEAESRVRQAVSDLEAHHRAAQDMQRGQLGAQRSIGGDVLWQGWVGRSRRNLQMQLAQVLVRKGQMMQALQQAHGRKIASDALLSDARADVAKKREKNQIEQDQRLFLFKTVRDGMQD